jgi:hypothetical protein
MPQKRADSTSSWNLASVEEKLPRRLSTQMILSMLDDFITAAAQPIFQNTTFARRIMMQVILHFSTDNRRKFSFLPKGELHARMLKALVCNDYSMVTPCKIDRSILNRIIMTSYEKIKPAMNLDYRITTSDGETQRAFMLERQTLAKYVGCPEHMLSPLAYWVKGYIKLYRDMNWAIVSKYMKLAYHTMLRYAHYSKMHVDRDDLFKNLVMTVQRAVDKCDQSKGTLTSYVEQWFVSARNNSTFSHVYNVSYILPAVVRRQLQKEGKPLNDFIGAMPKEEQEDLIESSLELRLKNEVDNKLMYVLRHVKGSEIAFLTLNLPVVLTEEEKDLLRGTHTSRKSDQQISV